jgi:Fur family transcriptional regulator, ferric uptake regulator
LNTEKHPRNSHQRKIILEELSKLRTHPTANEIYEIVRRRLPRISLGTVYRNLEILSESGLIQKLELAGAQKRFDGIVDNHYHVRCIRCGRVDDIPSIEFSNINDAMNGVSQYEILWHRLEFVGICPHCRNSELMGRSVDDLELSQFSDEKGDVHGKRQGIKN